MERPLLIRNVSIGVVVLLMAGAVAWFGVKRSGRSGAPAPSAVDESTGGSVAEPREIEPVKAPPNPDEPVWVWREPLDEPHDCDAVERDLEAFCAVLDAGPHGLDGRRSCDVITEAVVALAAQPPRASAELRRHADVLRNVHHAFRVLGRERLGELRRLAGDRALVEPGALALYRWIRSRERCDGPDVASTVMYDYASFAFTTLGGQAYLRRRAPAVEALACFWALHALDRSIAEGHNPNGVDPRFEIDRCSQLVATQPLLFRDRYAERLADMSDRWGDLAAP